MEEAGGAAIPRELVLGELMWMTSAVAMTCSCSFYHAFRYALGNGFFPWGRPIWTPDAPERYSKPYLRCFLFLLRRGVVDLDAHPLTQGAQHFVAAGYNFVAFLQAALDFDVRGARDAGFHGHEFRFFVANDEHTLLFVFLVLRGRCRSLLIFVFHQVGGVAHGQSLYRNRQYPGAGGRGDLRRRGKSLPKGFPRVHKRDRDLEVFRFLTGSVALRGGNPGRADQGVVSDFADDRLENLPREGIDGDLGGLP